MQVKLDDIHLFIFVKSDTRRMKFEFLKQEDIKLLKIRFMKEAEHQKI